MTKDEIEKTLARLSEMLFDTQKLLGKLESAIVHILQEGTTDDSD